jgi:hypothetical protein
MKEGLMDFLFGEFPRLAPLTGIMRIRTDLLLERPQPFKLPAGGPRSVLATTGQFLT